MADQLGADPRPHTVYSASSGREQPVQRDPQPDRITVRAQPAHAIQLAAAQYWSGVELIRSTLEVFRIDHDSERGPGAAASNEERVD
jgi:hypothetical protein